MYAMLSPDLTIQNFVFFVLAPFLKANPESPSHEIELSLQSSHKGHQSLWTAKSKLSLVSRRAIQLIVMESKAFPIPISYSLAPNAIGGRGRRVEERSSKIINPFS